MSEWLRNPEQRRNELNKRKIVTGVLLETSCDYSESFDVVKVDFNQIALAVFSAVQSRLLESIGMWADDRLHLLLSYLSDDFVRIVARVRDKCLSLGVLSDDILGNRGLVLLACSDLNVQRPPFGVDKCMELRGETTSRVTQRIDFDPPFPPEAS